jgi:hypothetical protein
MQCDAICGKATFWKNLNFTFTFTLTKAFHQQQKNQEFVFFGTQELLPRSLNSTIWYIAIQYSNKRKKYKASI